MKLEKEIVLDPATGMKLKGCSGVWEMKGAGEGSGKYSILYEVSWDPPYI
jgi:hypothetical protein